MPRGSSAKRERQYEHIKESGEERGMSEGRAKEMASRTVNKERARSGESKTSSRSSTQGKSASQRGGQKSKSGGGSSSASSSSSSSERTRDELYEEAKKRGIEGRSTMNKQQLKSALGD
ncbi:plasmid stabilization protein [Streptomyces sp. NPDC002990]